jgi:hypothetical protein
MHSALFVATLPPRPRGDVWASFTQEISGRVAPSQHALRLAENVWLINFSESPSELAFLIQSAERNSINYGIIPFRRQPVWLPAGLDPTTIQARTSH